MKKVYLIHHTHWDYEWYFTENESQIQLDFHVKELLKYIKEKKVTKYHLDGQTSIVESWLRDNPQRKSELVDSIKKKEIFTGPWYTQSDQFLVRSQSLNKNLELGLEKTSELGGNVDYAYVVDAFGQHPDMINIYLANNINKLVFWRGVDPQKITTTRFRWSENNQEIEAINLPYGYYYGYLLADYQELSQFIKRFEREFPEDDIVVPIGGDQRAVDYQINDYIKKYNQMQNEYEFVVSSYEELFKLPKQKLPVYSGEMLNGARSKIHRSISSTRSDHKKLNDKCENLLIYQVNPLLVMAKEWGFAVDGNVVDNIWRDLLKNHAHDSICSCNSDITNYHITHRYQSVIEKLESLIDYLVRKLSEAIGKNNQLFIYNTLHFSRNEVQSYIINTKSNKFKIMKQSQEIPYQVINQKKVYHGSLTYDNHDPDQFHYETEILFKIKVDAYDYQIIDIVEKVQSQLIDMQVSKSDQYLELIDFVFTADAGDNYDYSPLTNAEPIIIPATSAIKVKENNYQINVDLPVDLEAWLTNDYDCLINHQFDLKIEENNNLLDFKIEYTNKIKEFRFQIRWNQKLLNDFHLAEGPFIWQKRKNVDDNIINWQENNWAEEPTSIYPVINGINFNGCENIILNGTKEYEIKDNYLYITMARSINYLGKPGLNRRPGKASGQEFKWVQTPDSRMKSKQSYSFGYLKNDNLAIVKQTIQSYQNHFNYYQIQEYNRFTGRLKYFTSNKLEQLELMKTKHIDLNLPKGLVGLGIEIKNSGYQLQVVNLGTEKIEYCGNEIKVNEYKKIYLEEL